jgi:hypothetical protein
MQDEARTRPVKVFRCGTVRAAIWANRRVMDNAVVEVHSVKISKSYKEDEQWRETTTFAAEDLPKVALVATEAYRFLRLRSEEPSGKLEDQDTTEVPLDTDNDHGRFTAGSVHQPT